MGKSYASVPIIPVEWPCQIDGKHLTYEQHGIIIQLTLFIWSTQKDLTLEEARRVVCLDPRVMNRLNIPGLLSVAHRLAQARARITKKERTKVRALARNQCHYCGTELEKVFHVDHAVPISRGGKNRMVNYRASCIACNKEKNTLTEEEYRLVLLGGVE